MTSNELIVHLIRRDRDIRFLLSLPVAFALSFVVPLWAAAIYSFAMGYRS